MPIKIRLSAIFVILTLFSCADSTPSAPTCRTLNPVSNVENTAASSPQAAACIIRVQDSLLLIEHRGSGKLDFPGGTQQPNEPLPCTAHRETWEETGLNVLVGPKLSVTTNGLALYACHTNAGIDTLPSNFAAPPWAKIEVKGLKKVAPFSLTHSQLRFADDLIPLRDAFAAYSQYETQFKAHNP